MQGYYDGDHDDDEDSKSDDVCMIYEDDVWQGRRDELDGMRDEGHDADAHDGDETRARW